MNKYFMIPIIVVIFFFDSDCRNKSFFSTTQDEISQFQMKIFAPDGCYNELELSSPILGKIKSGTYLRETENENYIIDTILSMQSVDLNNKKDSRDIQRILKKIKNEEKKIGSIGKDAFRIQIFIDNECKMDLSGNTPDASTIIKIFLKNMRKPDNNCSFFQMFKAANNIK